MMQQGRARVRLLDLFCGAGGAAVGYSRAGFTEIVGVDIRPQPRYPFTFVLGDALDYVKEHGREFDVIHASPPCQGYSIMRNLPWLRGKKYPLLIAPTAEALNATGVPWVIENVMGAKLDSGYLCGTMFGLPFFRHRFFWAGGWYWLQPPHAPHRNRIRPGHSLAGRARDIVFSDAEDARGLQSWPGRLGQAGNGLTVTGVQRVRDALGIDWMRADEITQAIPPTYTEWIGWQLLVALSSPSARTGRKED